MTDEQMQKIAALRARRAEADTSGRPARRHPARRARRIAGGAGVAAMTVMTGAMVLGGATTTVAASTTYASAATGTASATSTKAATTTAVATTPSGTAATSTHGS